MARSAPLLAQGPATYFPSKIVLLLVIRASRNPIRLNTYFNTFNDSTLRDMSFDWILLRFGK